MKPYVEVLTQVAGGQFLVSAVRYISPDTKDTSLLRLLYVGSDENEAISSHNRAVRDAVRPCPYTHSHTQQFCGNIYCREG